jgi:hypothetical protein
VYLCGHSLKITEADYARDLTGSLTEKGLWDWLFLFGVRVMVLFSFAVARGFLLWAGGCFVCWAVVSFLSGCSFSERLFPLPRLSLLRRPLEDLVGSLI